MYDYQNLLFYQKQVKSWDLYQLQNDSIIFNDENGYHSQSGAYFTYAHHILFSRSELDLNMLSFGLSAGLIQYKLDESSFLNLSLIHI